MRRVMKFWFLPVALLLLSLAAAVVLADGTLLRPRR